MAGFDWLATSDVIAATIVVIGVLFVWFMIKEKRSAFPAVDERTQRLAGIAAIRALDVGWVFMLAVLLWGIVADVFFGMPSPNADYYAFSIIAALLVQALSFASFRWYLGRKGEQ